MSLSSGPGSEAWGGQPCTRGWTDEALGVLRVDMTGAELIAAMQPELIDLLEAVYGPPPEFQLGNAASATAPSMSTPQSVDPSALLDVLFSLR